MTASTHATEALLFSVLIQLVVMIAAARALNLLFRRMGQPGAVGEIVAGLLLGPSLLGFFFPELSVALFGARPAESITLLSQVGLILLMFQIGAEFEFGHLGNARNRRAAIAIAAVSIAVPFGLGIAIGQLSAATLAPGIDATVYSLFIGVALAITALPILGRILVQFDLNRHEIGVIAVAAAAVNDVVGWLLLASISAYAALIFSGVNAALQVGGVVALAVAARYGLAPLATWMVRRYPITDGSLPATLLALVLMLTFALAMATYQLGIFAIFGGFAAGLLFHRHGDFVAAWRRQVGTFVLVFFLPIFFTYTGLRTNLLGLGADDLAWLALVLVAAILGKIVPVYVTARALGFAPPAAGILGALMNTRALMELIVLNVGYDLGFIPQNMFTMLVVMAVLTTVMTGPILRLLLPRIGHKVPLDREA